MWTRYQFDSKQYNDVGEVWNTYVHKQRIANISLDKKFEDSVGWGFIQKQFRFVHICSDGHKHSGAARFANILMIE